MLTDSTPAISPGEHYAGILLGKDGNQSHHLILLPGAAKALTWRQALDWAKGSGGELPNRREQALLFANLADEFESAWYWSNAQHASSSVCAWCQYFGRGSQDDTRESSKLRARAVRRLPI